MMPVAEQAERHAPSPPFGIGIIGLSAGGGWASTAHLPALRSMPERFRVIGLAASSTKKAEAAGQEHEVALTTADPSVLAGHGDIDLVVVAVKVPQHRALVEAAIAGGKAVYCEWPLGRDTEEAIAMLEHAKTADVRHFIGLQARSTPFLQYVRDLVRDGYVGKILSSRVAGSGGFPWGGEAISSLAYALDDEQGGTLFTIPFGHMIDAFTWVLGEFDKLAATMAVQSPRVRLADMCETVAATGPDEVAVTGRLTSGTVVSLHYTGRDSPAGNLRWEIAGDGGTLLIEANSGHLQYGHVRISGQQGDAPLEPMAIPENYRRTETDADSYADGVAHAYRALFDDLTTGSAIVPDFAEAVKTHRLLDRIREAANWKLETMA